MDVQKIKINDPKYPALLKETSSPPENIFYKGVLPGNNEIGVAIVGTRRAKRDGIATAKKIAEGLARAGVTVISGLALGIDGAAHQGALEGGGKTIAVLGTGIDKIYPEKHFNLAEKIIRSGGCIISEYEPGAPSLPYQFLERNRIISGLSVATVVIEAPLRSGALSTARHALDQGREVFAVPGSALDRNYVGSHKLIRDGARLVASSDDIIEDLGITISNEGRRAEEYEKMDKVSKAIVLTLENGTLAIGDIIKESKLSPEEVQNKLGLLILSGIVKEENGKYHL